MTDNENLMKTLNQENFKRWHCFLDLPDLLQIKFKTKSISWQYMLIITNNEYRCQLCDKNLADRKIEKHLIGRKHKKNTKNIVEMYHPKYLANETVSRLYLGFNGLCVENPKSLDDVIEDNMLKVSSIDSLNDCSESSDPSTVIANDEDEGLQGRDPSSQTMDSEVHLREFINLYYDFSPNILMVGYMEKFDVYQSSKITFHNDILEMDSDENDWKMCKEISINEFKQLHCNLKLEQLLQVEYRTHSLDWSRMFIKTDFEIICNLCNIGHLTSKMKVLQHINSFIHQIGLKESVIFMYHPTYCPLDLEKSIEVRRICNTYPADDGCIIYFDQEFMCSLCEDEKPRDIKTLGYHLLSLLHMDRLSEEELDLVENQAEKKNENQLDAMPDNFLEITNETRKCWNFATEDFKMKYSYLGIGQLLEVQFKKDFGWRYMLTKYHGNYICNLCGGVKLNDMSKVKEHIHDMVHSNNLNDISMLYHPIYCPLNANCTMEENMVQKSIANTETDKKHNMLELTPKSMLKAFKLEYVKLNLDELLKIQYSIDCINWRYMIKHIKDEYACNLCGKRTFDEEQDVFLHLKESTHLENVHYLSGMYHPHHFPIKQTPGMTIEHFKLAYVDLNIIDLLQIHYKINGYRWISMFVHDKRARYICNLCDKLTLHWIDDVFKHIRSKEHCEMVKHISDMQPIVCDLKNRVMQSSATSEFAPEMRIKKEKYTVEELKTGEPLASNQLDFEQFKVELLNLTFYDLLRVEYALTSNDWNYMVTSDGDKYICNICETGSFKNIQDVRNHVFKGSHLKNLQSILGMIRPTHCISVERLSNRRQLNLKSINSTTEVVSWRSNHPMRSSVKTAENSPILEPEMRSESCEKGLENSLNENNIENQSIASGSPETNSDEIIESEVPSEKSAEVDQEHQIASEDFPNALKEQLPLDNKPNESVSSSTKSEKEHKSEIYNVEEFKTAYLKLYIKDVLNIKYQLNSDEWLYMVQQKNEAFFCNLCGPLALGKSAFGVDTHLRGGRHSKQVKAISNLYHPVYCPGVTSAGSSICGSQIDSSSSCVENQSTSASTVSVVSSENSSQVSSNDASKKDTPNYCEKELIEVRYSAESFFKKYVKMEIEKLLTVSYTLDSVNWKCMIICKNNQYTCNLCGNVPLSGVKNVEEHICGRNHISNMQKVMECKHKESIPLEKKQNIIKFSGMHSKFSSPCVENQSSLESTVSEVSFRSSSQVSSNLSHSGSFLQDYTELEIVDLLKIKFTLDSINWSCMIICKDKQFACKLCGNARLPSIMHIKDHICGKSHAQMVKNIVALYYPDDSIHLEIHQGMIKEFKTGYVNLCVDDLLKIEYQTFHSTTWQHLIQELPVRYICNLCWKMSFSEANIMSHIRSSVHLDNLENVDSMYHPILSANIKEGANQLSSKSSSSSKHVLLKAFKNQYVDLDVFELLKIEFHIGNTKNWQFLIEKTVKYTCNLCWQVNVGDRQGLTSHIRSDLHLENIKSISVMYHPLLCPVKQYKKADEHPQMNPKLQAKNIKTDKVPTTAALFQTQFMNSLLQAGKQNQQQKNNIQKPTQRSYSTAKVPEKLSSNKVTITFEDFKLKYTSLSIDNLLKVQFRRFKSKTLEYLLIATPQGYICTLCGYDRLIGGMLNVHPHVKGYQHTIFLNTYVCGLKHPMFNVTNGVAPVSRDDLSNENNKCPPQSQACVQKEVKVETQPEKPIDVAQKVAKASNVIDGILKLVGEHDRRCSKEGCVVECLVNHVNSMDCMAEYEQPDCENDIRMMHQKANTKIDENLKRIKQYELNRHNVDDLMKILRHLSAMEKILGVLGPMATDLLTKSLMVEKTRTNSDGFVLLPEENILFLETTLEKLRGMIEIDMLEGRERAAALRVIAEISVFVVSLEEAVKEDCLK